MKLLFISFVVAHVAINVAMSALSPPKVVYRKGGVVLLRNHVETQVNKGLILETGDLIKTSENSLVIIKSSASTLKISSNSVMKLNFDNPEVINSDILIGTAVIRFLNKKLRPSTKEMMTVKTPTASLGVRGTRFFTFVGKKKNNVILSVDNGIVAFAGTNTNNEVLVRKNSSSMVNMKSNILKSRKFGFEKLINWSVDDRSEDLKHDGSLSSSLEKTWVKYKNENAKIWKKHTKENENLWEKFKNNN